MNALPASRRVGPGIVIAGLTLLLAVAVVHGVLAFGCYLINEHRRLVWSEIVLMWTGDVLALVWFVGYTVSWWRGRELTDARVDELPRSLWWLTGSFALGIAAELGVTLEHYYDEFVGFQRAVPAACQVTAATAARAAGAATYWKLDGHYADAAGKRHRVTYYLREQKELQRLPAAVVANVRQRNLPLVLPIVYDPQRPSRSWIPQLGWDDENRLHYFSMLVLLFQLLFTLFFVFQLRENVRSTKRWPWWAELYKVLPLACEAFVIALFGGLELWIVRRFCP